MKSYLFQVVIEEDRMKSGQQVYGASCPALPGCHTWGQTYDEALANIREAVSLYVETLLDRGEIPPVDPASGVTEVPSPSVLVTV